MPRHGQARRTPGPHLPGTTRLHDRLNAAHSQRPAPEVAQSWPDSHLHRQITICNPLLLLAHAEEIVEDRTPLERDGRVSSCITIGLDKAQPSHLVQCALALPSIGGLLVMDAEGQRQPSAQRGNDNPTVHDICVTTIVTLRNWPLSTAFSLQLFIVAERGTLYGTILRRVLPFHGLTCCQQ